MRYRNYDDISVESTACCGLGELDGLSQFSNPEDTCIALLTTDPDNSYYYKHPSELDDVTKSYAHILFTEAMPKGLRGYRYGNEFAKYIVAQKLGTVVQTSAPRRNPNSGNMVSCFLWTPDHKGIEAWFKRMKKAGKLGEDE